MCSTRLVYAPPESSLEPQKLVATSYFVVGQISHLYLTITVVMIPFILNPFRWAIYSYLAAWPIIIQILGHQTLSAHATILTLFLLACDLSLALGFALLALFLTTKGAAFLSMISPIFNLLLNVAEPMFLFIETIIVVDIVRSFNRWISRQSNIRDEDSQDLSNWEPPLTRGSLLTRISVVLLALASYVGTYFIIQEAKQWLDATGLDVPIQFNHAIAMLVTLQLVAFTATIYKEEGILSETAIIALTAAIPIFIASWSYHNMKTSSSVVTR